MYPVESPGLRLFSSSIPPWPAPPWPCSSTPLCVYLPPPWSPQQRRPPAPSPRLRAPWDDLGATMASLQPYHASAVTRPPLLVRETWEGVGVAAPPSAWRQYGQQGAARTDTTASATGLAVTGAYARRCADTPPGRSLLYLSSFSPGSNPLSLLASAATGAHEDFDLRQRVLGPTRYRHRCSARRRDLESTTRFKLGVRGEHHGSAPHPCWWLSPGSCSSKGSCSTRKGDHRSRAPFAAEIVHYA